jgi:Tol biopolymer transport system component
MIRPSILQTIELVQRTMERGQLDPGSVHAALLVGGSSRIPLVSQLVGEHLDMPVRIDAHPKLVTARGAARKAASGGPVGPVESAGGGSRRKLLLVGGGIAAVAALAAGAFVVLGGDDDPSNAGGTTTPSVTTTVGGADDDSVPEVFPTAGEPIPTNVVIYTRLRSDGTRQLWSLDVERPPDDPQRTQRLATGLGSTWDNLPAISPDRRLIAYTTEQAGRFVLAVAAWDGGERLLLMDGEPVAVANDARATWSSDGTKLAYVANRGGSDDLYVYDATTQSERRLTDDDFSEADPSWSPTADEILYTVEAADTGLDIMRLPAAGGTPERVTAEPGDDSDPSWSPDGAEIAFTRRQPAEGAPSELFVMDRDGTRIRRLIDPAFDTGSPLKDDADPSWSPDGARIAFESARNDGLWVVDAAGQRDPEPLADDDTWVLVHPAWR